MKKPLWLQIGNLSQFYVAAKSIRQPHLTRTTTLGFKKAGAPHDDHHCLSARGRDIKTIQAVEKFHSSRSILRRRCRHRVDHDWCLLALEFIDRTYRRLRKTFRQIRNLSVVRGNDEHVAPLQRAASL